MPEFGRENLLRVYEFIKWGLMHDSPGHLAGTASTRRRSQNCLSCRRSPLRTINHSWSHEDIDPEYFPGLRAQPWWELDEIDQPEWVEKVVQGLPYASRRC